MFNFAPMAASQEALRQLWIGGGGADGTPMSPVDSSTVSLCGRRPGRSGGLRILKPGMRKGHSRVPGDSDFSMSLHAENHGFCGTAGLLSPEKT